MKGFAKRMQVKADKFDREVSARVRKIALAIDAALVLATPVDTGRARANWQVSLDEPVETTVESTLSAAQNTRMALESGKEQIAKYERGSSIHITNNLPYIGRLDKGHSAQAPAGFVEKAVLVGVRAAKGELLK